MKASFYTVMFTFNAMTISILASGYWTEWYTGACRMPLEYHTISSNDSSAYITDVCVTTINSSFHELVSIQATYSNGFVSGPFGDSSGDDDVTDCFAVIDTNECLKTISMFTGYYLNFLQFSTSTGRSSDAWGVRSGNDWSTAVGNEGTCLSKMGISFTSVTFMPWDKQLVSIRYYFDAFQATTADPSTELPETEFFDSTTIQAAELITTQTTNHTVVSLDTSGCDGIQYIMDGMKLYIPAGVCSVVYDETTQKQHSIMHQCNADGTDVIMHSYSTLNCSGSASSTVSYVHTLLPILSVKKSEYRIFCGGDACSYGIQREYPTSNCDDDVDTVADKYADGVFVMDYCQNIDEDMSMKWVECMHGEIEYKMYSDANCSAPFIGDIVYSNGKRCDEDDGHQFEVVCGVADVVQRPAETKAPMATESTEPFEPTATQSQSTESMMTDSMVPESTGHHGIESTAVSAVYVKSGRWPFQSGSANNWLMVALMFAILLVLLFGFCAFITVKKRRKRKLVQDGAYIALTHDDNHI